MLCYNVTGWEKEELEVLAFRIALLDAVEDSTFEERSEIIRRIDELNISEKEQYLFPQRQEVRGTWNIDSLFVDSPNFIK